VLRSVESTGWADAPALHVIDREIPAVSALDVLDVEIIVPALNEEFRLGATLERIAEYLAAAPYSAAIAVVDNGSVDRTVDLVVDTSALAVPVRLIGCARPGKGAAVRRGVLTSTARYVGFCDADLSAPIETLDAMLAALDAGSHVAVASRRCPGAEYVVKQPFERRVTSRAFRLASCMLMPQLARIHDTQCGFKLFEARVARQLFGAARVSGFAFDVEILALALLAGFDVAELPIRWEHRDGSKLNIARDARRVLGELRLMHHNVGAIASDGFPVLGSFSAGASGSPSTRHGGPPRTEQITAVA
jgi:glycosyltransferase involved in cell wall biosynthesis